MTCGAVSHSSQCSTTGVTEFSGMTNQCSMTGITKSMLIKKSRMGTDARFLFLLSEWSFTICLMPYKQKQNVLNALLNNNFLLSFL